MVTDDEPRSSSAASHHVTETDTVPCKYSYPPRLLCDSCSFNKKGLCDFEEMVSLLWMFVWVEAQVGLEGATPACVGRV